MTIKKDDNVIILKGRDKGKTGKVIKSIPRESRVIVAGINTVKKHEKPRKQGQKGQVVDKPMPIHVSNVALADAKKK
jgi:large subunit ribosomal protein L24